MRVGVDTNRRRQNPVLPAAAVHLNTVNPKAEKSAVEAITEHVLEPELPAPVPRRLRLPGCTCLLLSIAALLLGLCVLGSGRAL